jgi:hypothetical protein
LWLLASPHHVTQRGNGGARTFFNDEDYAFYKELLGRQCREAGVEVWVTVTVRFIGLRLLSG